jgi:hypothetical protein
MAAADGAILGGGIKGAAALWAKARTGTWPTSVRDAGNVATREAAVDDAPWRGSGAQGEIEHRQRLASAEDAMVHGAPVELPPDTFSSNGWRPGRVYDSEGRSVGVSYEVVEADDLVVSNLDDFSVNPSFPAELQPRDRTRAMSQDQVNGIASQLDPERLGPSTNAADGAPIIGPDGVVESGNGRVLALRRVYADEGTNAASYKNFLKAQGFDPGEMRQPVLVARRVTDLDPAERQKFAAAANRATVLRLSATEQALADARLLILSAQFNGMDGMKVISRALGEMMTDPATARMAAARMGLVAHAVSDAALGVKRFQDETFDRNMAGKLATFVIRAQGLQAWTESIKRAFSMEFFAMMAENSGKGLHELDEPFRNFLTRYNFTPKQWDALQQTPQIEERGARFFDMEGIADVGLKERLIGAVLDERQFAVLEPSGRVPQLTSGGLQRGTFWGEAARSLMMYKSFPLALIASHAVRVATRSDLSSKIGYGSALLAYTTLAGAATILAKDVIAGKDPRALNDWKFLGASVIAGGGTGIFGDLLYSGVTRANTSLAGTLFGPAAAGVDQVGRLVFPAIRTAWKGEEANFGGELARAIKSNMPGSNIWYLRTALNRAVFDQFQIHLDPDYRSSFRRMEQRAKKELGQDFWWDRGRWRRIDFLR